jgi:starch synthase
MLKGAIVTADKIITVSPTYAQEIKTPEHSNGLHEIIKQNEYKLKGILNGLDYEFYNPATDKVIYTNFDVDNMENKKKNKELLQKEFGLEVVPDKPIVAFCSRINALKGFDLVKGCIEKLVNELDIQVVGVGSGDREYVDFFNYLNNKYPKNVHVSLGFSLEIGKKIYSGADIYIMPSLTEPCGLSQLVASRYGVVPIVRETGGLKDTITDFGCLGGGNGYTFTNPVVGDLE